MEIRKTRETDIPAVVRIYTQAQEYMAKNGIIQWINGYPNQETLKEDMAQDNSYVIVDQDKVVGTCYISFEPDPNYTIIEEGQWLSDAPYGVIHRIAIENSYKGKGVGSKLFSFAEERAKERQVYSLRVDTHKDNLNMQRLIQKNGFHYCGIVYMKDRSLRNAYQKEISK